MAFCPAELWSIRFQSCFNQHGRVSLCFLGNKCMQYCHDFRLLHTPLPAPPPHSFTFPNVLQNTKAVGWADSTRQCTNEGKSVYGQTTARGGREGGGSTPHALSSSAAAWQGPSQGVVGSSLSFQENRSRLEAAMAGAGGLGGGFGGFDPQVRSARGGASWTVPTNSSSSGSGRGSAEVWPAPSCSVAGGASAGSGVRDGVGRGSGERSASSPPPQCRASHPPLPPPLPPPPPPPPPSRANRIPPPASRPLDALWSSSPDVDRLAEMGFARAHAAEALRSCGGNVERAAEWLLTAGGEDDGSGIGAGGGGVTFGPQLNPGAREEGWGGGTELDRIVGETGKGGRGNAGGVDDDADDDLITTADAADVGQGLDLGDFWATAPVAAGTGGGVSDGGRFDGGAGWRTAGAFGEQEAGAREEEKAAAALAEEENDGDLVTRCGKNDMCIFCHGSAVLTRKFGAPAHVCRESNPSLGFAGNCSSRVRCRTSLLWQHCAIPPSLPMATGSSNLTDVAFRDFVYRLPVITFAKPSPAVVPPLAEQSSPATITEEIAFE